MVKICIIGTGYVGLVTGACIADFGFSVTCTDSNKEKIDTLNRGEVPIYEPGLPELIARNTHAGRLAFSTGVEECVGKSDVVFIAVGTPPREDGSADLCYVDQVARLIGRNLNSYKVIVIKSTVPVATAQYVRQVIDEVMTERDATTEFDLVSNPEFLRQGSAVHDFMNPDRVVIGVETEQAREVMLEVYRTLNRHAVPFLFTNIETSEMIKYATNAFLATKITFINEIANLCEAVGANVKHVAKALGMDARIGKEFLNPGPGYGGSCFPKDTRALAYMGRKHGSPVTLVESVVEANENQKRRMVEKIASRLGGVGGKTLAVLGLTFKPNTDDLREAPSLPIIADLAAAGATIRAFDPQGMPGAAGLLSECADSIIFCRDAVEALQGADAMILLTEWDEFRRLDMAKVHSLLASPILFDLRNAYEREDVEREGLEYIGVGV